MPPNGGAANTTGSTSITKTTEAPSKPTTGTKTSTKPTDGTKKGLSGEPSPSYKRKILDISKFSVSFHLLHVV